MRKTATAEDGAGPAEDSSLLGSWPALLLVVCVVVAAVLSFAHRPLPPFPPTRVHPDQLLVTSLARIGPKLIAAGEQGRILVAEHAEGPWREAKVTPQRGSTFTQVIAIGGAEALAVGHDGWIVRSDDAGESWTEAAFTASSEAAGATQIDPLLGVAGPYDGKLFAFGGFGRYMTSTDGGKTWTNEPPVEAGKAEAVAVAEVDPNADPFANVSTGSSLTDHHFNAMTRAADGSLVLVGERGLIARSTDLGASWTKQAPVYGGSFYGALTLPSGEVIIHGMRGNTFFSKDYGQTWQKSEVPLQQSLMGNAVASDGSAILVGAGNTILVSKDGGASFTAVGAKDRKGLAALVPLDNQRWLTGGEGGIAVQVPAPQTAANGEAP